MINRNNPMKNGENQKLFNPKEGFEKGNIFSNLYSEYKKYKPQTLKPMKYKERKLLNIQAIMFIDHDLNLYLDLHPEDQSMVTLFIDYRRQIILINISK